MKRFATTVPGLDEILHGGLFEAGVYILEGPPGVGKTTLANQIAFAHVANCTTLYVTLLAESHTRMLQHMQGQTFYKADAVNATVIYLSAYRELEKHGLKSVLELIRGELGRHHANMLVIDGLVFDNRQGQSVDGVRQFVHELQSLASMAACTCLLLTSGSGGRLNAEQAMVDGIFVFEDHAHLWRTERRMQIAKFRGSAVERGQHTFCITDNGLRFFPRLEGMASSPRRTVTASAPLPSGTAGLDQILPHGGFLPGSSTLLRGDSGSGKTLFALSFLARSASLDRRALLFAFTETAEDLARLGQAFGLPIAEGIDSGALEVHAQGQEDEALDEKGHKLLRMIDELDTRLLVVDGLAGVADTFAFPERGYRFMGRLLSELKARGVTSVFTVDPAALDAVTKESLTDGLAGWFDNVLEIASPADSGQTRRLRVRKLRATHVGANMLEIRLDPGGRAVS